MMVTNMVNVHDVCDSVKLTNCRHLAHGPLLLLQA